MEVKNPLENERIKNIYNYINELEMVFSNQDVLNDVIKIRELFDDYFGVNLFKTLQSSVLIEPTSGLFNDFYSEKLNLERRLKKEADFLNRVREPLNNVKLNLSRNNPFYVKLSTIIVAEVRDAVFQVISDVETKSIHTLPSKYDNNYRFNLYSFLIPEAFKIFNILKEFDMTNECSSVFLSKYNKIEMMKKNIDDVIIRNFQKTANTSKEGTGCLLSVLIISTSIATFLFGYLYI